MKRNKLMVLTALSLALPLMGCTATQQTELSSASVKPMMSAKASSYDREGFTVIEDEGRLWIFRDGSEDLAKFKEHGEPAKMVVLPGAGPDRKTLKGTDRDTMMEYALSKPGFKVIMEDGRLWIFEAGSEALAQFEEHGEPAKQVVRPGAGPRGITLKSVESSIIDAYLAAK
jgi:hypothetical protein